MTSRRPHWLTLLLALGLTVPLIGLLGVTPTATAAAPAYVRTTVGGYLTYAHFANPDTHNGRDETIINEVKRLIDSTPAGETIRGNIYSLSVDRIAQALRDAQTRKVKVVISLDQQNDNDDESAVTYIRQLTNHHFCTGPGQACISNDGSSIAHAKYYTFSKTLDPAGAARTNVSWFGSANMTYGSGSDQFNNAITVYGDPALFAGLNKFADAMYNQSYRGTNFYDSASGRGYYLGAAASAYASPEAAGETDTIVTRLNDMTGDSQCQLRIGMAFVNDSRPELVKLVKTFRSKGCRVWMVVGSENGKIHMDSDVYKELSGAGVKIRRAAKGNLHDKFFLAYGKFGSAYQYKVYTGSQNWSSSALSRNDELFVKMAPETESSHPLYQAFYDHFNDAYNAGK